MVVRRKNSAACFARSSPRLEAWLLNHPRFGPALCAWREERAIPRRAKIAACIGIAFLSRIGLEREVAAGELCWVPLAEGIVRPASVSILLQRGRVLPIYLSSFVDMLKEEFARLDA